MGLVLSSLTKIMNQDSEFNQMGHPVCIDQGSAGNTWGLNCEAHVYQVEVWKASTTASYQDAFPFLW